MQAFTFLHKIRLTSLFSSRIFRVVVWLGMSAWMLHFLDSQKLATAFLTLDWSQHVILLVFLVVLSGLNWLAEAKKWQTCLSMGSSVGLSLAIRSVFQGLALHFSSPFMAGDAVGKYLALRKHVSWQVLLNASFWSNASQFIVTLALGLLSLCFWLNEQNGMGMTSNELAWIASPLNHPLSLLLLIVAFFAIGFALISQREKLGHLFRKPKWQSIFSVFLWASLRYFIFWGQFVLVLYGLGVELDWQTLGMGVSVVFLLKSMVPAFNALFGLGIREMAALLVFGSLGAGELAVLASVVLWVINLVLPACVGLLMLGVSASKQ